MKEIEKVRKPLKPYTARASQFLYEIEYYFTNKNAANSVKKTAYIKAIDLTEAKWKLRDELQHVLDSLGCGFKISNYQKWSLLQRNQGEVMGIVL